MTAPLTLLLVVGCGSEAKKTEESFTQVEPGEDSLSEVPAPTDSGGETLELVAPGGQLDCALHESLGRGTSQELWDYRLGPTSAYFHEGGLKVSDHLPMGPDNGEYCHLDCRAKPTDWAGKGGQTLYLTDGSPGMDRTRFVWSKHEGHGGSEYNHLYQLQPINAESAEDSDSWFTATPDPAFAQDLWLATGALTTPTAMARGRIQWSNNALVGWRHGLVGAVGSGNSSDDFPFVMLDGLVPMAIAITLNNELGFVAAWDPASCESQLVVIALKGRNGFPWLLPNHGFFEGAKVLGAIPLPISAPTAIQATVNHSQWAWTQKTDLSDATERQRWIDREEDHRVAQAGYVVVASRDEGKVVWVDIAPTLQWIEKSYFGTTDDFADTQGSDWPSSFEQFPEATPQVVHSEDVEQPTVLVAGYQVGDRHFLGAEALFSKRTYVATLGGDLLAYDVEDLFSGGDSPPVLAGTHELCKNPTDVWYGHGTARRDLMVFTCRGDRQVALVAPDGSIQQVLIDDRIGDPVSAMMQGTRSATVISVGDYSGNRVLNYQVGPLLPWGDEVFTNQPAKGESLFLGALEVDGPVVGVSAAEVP